ncbi:MAG: hypothetical protein U5J78_00950 [Parasphingorhabdus sp.]|nr:hypothetical protein [Parasphingorhabdus sp.]
MVVLIVAIIAIASVFRARNKAQRGIIEDEYGNENIAHNPDTARVTEEVRALKDRIATLERIITDGRSARDLDSEIEKLRDR